MSDLGAADVGLRRKIAETLDECCHSQAIHERKRKELSNLRSATKSQSMFISSFIQATRPLFEFGRRTASAERVVRFISGFAVSEFDEEGLDEFLRFLIMAAKAGKRDTRFRACHIISEIVMRLPDDAEVISDVWDEVIDIMKQRIDDKIPAIRGFAVRALSRFANDEENGDTISIFLEALPQESNAEVRKAIVLSMPPSAETCTAIIASTLDVSEAVRRAAYCVLASKFPLQSLSIKLRTTILQRGLSDRSPTVYQECLKMLKDEWLMKSCGGDIIALLRFLDVETYESVGETVMETLLKEGMVRVLEGQSIRQYLASSDKAGGEPASSIQLMEAEVALYWKTLCKHLQTVAHAKGSDAATTTGTEAAVYASEASDSNDLLEEILPVTISDYVELINAHLSAGPNYRFASRQLLLLGATLDFSDTTNRKVASSFVHELMLRPFEYEEDDDGNKIIIGDGISIGGDREWARAISELAKKVHASVGEFETVVTSIIEEVASACRERIADVMQWMHCLSLIGLLLENIESSRILHGKAIEPSEILHSLLLPGAKHIHLDVQRIAIRCLCLFGLLENKLTEDLVKQLRISYIDSKGPVRVMASKALMDLVTWHGPQELDKAIGLDFNDEKTEFVSVDLSNSNDDQNIGVLDLLYSGLNCKECDENAETDDVESVQSVLGEGFAKILLLSDNYPNISSSLHTFILCKLVGMYFSDEDNDTQKLKQCLSVFFEHYPALSLNHKKTISKTYIPVMRSMWPGIYGNSSGSSALVSRLRKRALQASRFMLQMIQIPLFTNEDEEQKSNEKSTEMPPTSNESSFEYETTEEGLAIRIAVEVVNFPERKSAAGKSYVSALCKAAGLIQFRRSEQEAIKCMRILLNGMILSASTDKVVVEELKRMAVRLKSLDNQPDEEFPQEKASKIFEKLGVDVNLKVETLTSIPPPTPAPRATRAAPARRRVARRDHSSSSSDEDEDTSQVVPVTPSLVVPRSQRASKTVALTKMTAKVSTLELSDIEIEEESDVTSDDSSDSTCEG